MTIGNQVCDHSKILLIWNYNLIILLISFIVISTSNSNKAITVQSVTNKQTTCMAHLLHYSYYSKSQTIEQHCAQKHTTMMLTQTIEQMIHYITHATTTPTQTNEQHDTL